MQKEILRRGYVTHCLTGIDRCGNTIFYNIKRQEIYNWGDRMSLYWNEVYCEPGYVTALIRDGQLITDLSNIQEKHKQSIINCSE